MKQVFVHIGTHKTGTTSIQRYLADHGDHLSKNGARFFKGRIIPHNHVELHMSAMLTGRTSPIHLLQKIDVDEDFRQQTLESIRAELERSPEDCLLFSAEGLSYLRHDAEIKFLQSAFRKCAVNIIVYLRDKKAYLESYRRQMKRLGFQESSDESSFAYTGPDTWLARWEDLLSVYQRGFGTDNVIVKNYEAELKVWGNIVSSYLNALGIPAHPTDPNAYWHNRSRRNA